MQTLQEILGSKSRVQLEFSDLIIDESTQDGSPILRLVMKEAIPLVYGRNINDQMSGETITLEARDVERVSIGAEALTAINAKEDEIKKAIEAGDKTAKLQFIWDVEGKSGRLECGLKLDVSAAGEVWVVKTGFAAFGAQKRRERRSNQNSALIKKIQDAKTKAEFKGETIPVGAAPASVAGN